MTKIWSTPIIEFKVLVGRKDHEPGTLLQITAAIVRLNLKNARKFSIACQ